MTAPRRTGTRGVAALVVALAALAGACGRGGGGRDEEQSLEEQVGFDQQTAADREQQAEVEIQQCMEAQGFDYVAVDPVARRAALLGSAGVSEDEFEDRFGYGITTLYEQRRRQAAAGPNHRIRAALPAEERAAYDRALRGDNLDATFADAVDSGDFGRLGGCTREAAEKVYGGADVLRGLQDGLAELEQRVLADPRMARAVDAWATCMRRAGWELTYPEEVDVVLKRRLTAVVGTDPAGAGDPDATPSYDTAALQSLQQEEVRMVSADRDCEHRHVAAVEDKVRSQYEQQFRERNVDLLAKVPSS